MNLQRRLFGGEGANRVHWRDADIARLAAFYGCDVPAFEHREFRLPNLGALETSKGSDSGKEFTFTISTGAVDRMGDTVSPSGWKLCNYMRSPVVLFAHDSGSLPVGKANRVWVENGRLRATAKFAPTNMGERVKSLVESGFLKSTSVGFLPIKWSFSDDKSRKFGIDFHEQELLEFSVVPVPANPEAQLDGSFGKSLTPDQRRRERALALMKLGPCP